MTENGTSLSVFLQPSSPNLNDSDFIPRTANGSMYDASLSPGHGYDITTIRSENRILKTKLRQMQSDLQIEQDSVASLRRKLNSTERERLDAISKANEEVNRLDNEVAKLRAQLEKGEAVRQNLEYELTKAKRDISHEKRSVSERDALISEVNDTMKQKIHDLTAQVEGLCDELDNTKLKANEDIRKLKRELEEKDTELDRMRADVQGVENEKTKLEYTLQQSNDRCRDLEDKAQELEEDKRVQADELRRQITEFEMLKEQHEMRKQDLQEAGNRVKTLEEGIEAERAAHLESKFNSEIVQLRMRDLESALDLEKNTKLEALASTEKLNHQLKDLQHIYDDERKLSLETKEKLEKAEKEYASLSKQLNRELEEKRTVIKDLSRQLEAHQKDFNDLKHELNKAKKRQINLEDTYTGCVRELEILNDNFKAEDVLNTAKKSAKKKGSSESKPQSSKPPQPAVMLESLRHTLLTYKRKLDESNSDLDRTKEQKDQLEKEAKKYRDQAYSKDKALHSSQSGVAETTKELRRVQEDNRSLEKLIAALREDLDAVHKQAQSEKTKAHELAEQCSQVVSKSKASERSMSEFMVHLYQQLAVEVPAAEKCDVRGKSFDDLSLLFTQHATKITNNMRWMSEKIKHLEVSLANKEELVEQMQRAHEEQMEKLAGVAEGRSQQWLQQKAEMEKHYRQLLGEIHGRHTKTQALADQAWEKVRMTGSLQQGLERECEDLRKQLVRMQDEHHCLLATSALLAGALYPMYQRNNALAAQREILTEQFYNFQAFKREVQKLIDALSLDKLNDKNVDLKPFTERKMGPLVRFRTAAVAVIAANRLKHLQGSGCRMFVTQDGVPGLLSATVCTGGVDDKHSAFKGVADPQLQHTDSLAAGEAHAIEWLCSGNLLSTVLATMGELVSTLHKSRRGEQGYDQRKVVQTARNCFQKFVCHLPSTFPTMPCDSTAGLRERNSLLRFLGYGLNRALAHSSLEGGESGSCIESSAHMVSALQQHMLEFTKRLHMAEVERRDLRVEVNKLNKERQARAEFDADTEKMAEELSMLRGQVDDTVDRSRFDQVCSELNRALGREQEAQKLLNEQNTQILQLGARLERSHNKGSEKEQTLGEAVQGLADAKMELKRQEQRVRQLNRHISQMETEKRPLNEKVKDAETALRTAARDRESLINYLRNVESMLKQLQAHIPLPGGQGFSRLLSPELLPPNLSKLGPEVVACQSLVAAFVDVERLLGKRLLGLQEELEQHRQHAARLKQELSNAVKREYDDELDKLQMSDGQPVLTEPFTPSRPMMGGASSPGAQRKFTPLQEDSSMSSPQPKPKTPHASKLPAPTKSYTSSVTKYPATNRTRRGPTDGGERK